MRCVVALKLSNDLYANKVLKYFHKSSHKRFEIKKEIYHMLDGVASANRVDFKIFL